MYLGVVLDRRLGRPVMMACSEGGVEIEEVASRNPDAILKADFDETQLFSFRFGTSF